MDLYCVILVYIEMVDSNQ